MSTLDLPGVSVVMSVFDRAGLVARSIDSVLGQKDIELEFIIIDDGADTQVKALLAEYGGDQRIRIIEQTNQGLTHALMVGCERAQYSLIARLDAGDTMLPGRLSAQAQLLSANPQVGLVSCWVDMVTEEGYPLYQVRQTQPELHAAVLSQDATQLRTPFHASVMFRKSVYSRAGGYRREFYFAQDCDLWSRMALVTDFGVVEKVLTIGLFSPQGLSGQYASQQLSLKKLVAFANRLRAQGQSDAPVLLDAKKYRPALHAAAAGSGQTRASDFKTLYFLARCLHDNRSEFAANYWRRVISARPWSLRSWYFLWRSLAYQDN